MIYLDNASTTPPYKEVLDLFVKVNSICFANPASTHSYGREASKMVESSRSEIKDLLGVGKSHELVFTGSATDANNIAIKGIARNYKNRGNKIITSSVEHSSVAKVFASLEKEGFEVVYLPVDENGIVNPKTLEEALDNKTILVSIMGVNNEVGSLFPLEEYAEIVHRFPKCFFHSDLTQGMGKVNFDYSSIDVFTFSSHKFGGLKGVGGLVYNKKIKFLPVENGGEQEYGIRPGTLNVGGIITTSLALKLSLKDRRAHYEHVLSLRNHLVDKIKDNELIVINKVEPYSPYVINIAFKKHKASVVLEALSEKEIYVSSLSACTLGQVPESSVLKAMHKESYIYQNSMRISFSHLNTIEEIDLFVATLESILKTLAPRDYVR